MTLAEYAELYLINEDLFATHAMNYVAMIFAYIIAAHFVGPILTRIQVSVVTILYSAFIFGPINDILKTVQSRQLLGEKIRSLSPEDFQLLQPIEYAPGNVYFLLAVSVCGWAMSLFYMWQVRTKIKEDVATQHEE